MSMSKNFTPGKTRFMFRSNGSQPPVPLPRQPIVLKSSTMTKPPFWM